MTLFMAGGGISIETLTLGVLSLAKSVKKVYVETYTVPGSEWLVEKIREIAEDKIIVAERSTLEENIQTIIEEAKLQDILIVVPGDPLIATTHRSIIVEALKKNVDFRLLPGVSGVCAAKTVSGLDYYKFGRTLTLPGPWRHVKPYSVYYYLVSNLCIGLHTLLLLDIDNNGRQLEPCIGLKLLREVEEELVKDLEIPSILDTLIFIVVSRAGMKEQSIRIFDKLEKLCENDTRPPASIIIPGIIAEYEKEYLQLYADNKVKDHLHLYRVNPKTFCEIRERLEQSL